MSSVVKYISPIIFFVMTCAVNFLTGAGQTFSFPKPAGPYAVGYHDCSLVIEQKKGGVTHALKLTLWYPADASDRDKSCCSREAKNLYEERLTQLGHSEKVQDIASLETHYFLQANLNAHVQKMPIILCSPALGYSRHDYVVPCSSLASYGFCVVAIDHDIVCDTAWELCSDQERANVIARYCQDYTMAISWLQLQEIDVESPLFTRLDLAHIGIVGHLQSVYSALTFARSSNDVRALVALHADDQEILKELIGNIPVELLCFDIDHCSSDKVSDDSYMTEESLSSNGSASDDMLTAPWLYLLSKEKNKKDLVQLRQRSGSWASIQEHNYPVSYPYVSSFVAGQIAQFFKKSLSYRLL